MPFEVKQAALDTGITVLALTGTMTMGNQLQKLEWTVEELSKKQVNKILFDMSGISYLDSSAIGMLVASHGILKTAGGELRLSGVTERVAAIFKMTGVSSLLNVD